MKQLTIICTGIVPLIMHNPDEFMDPSSSIAVRMKELTSKRSKTEEDHKEMKRLETIGGLYLEKDKIVIPTRMHKGTWVAGAKKLKLGNKAKIGMFPEKSSVLKFKDMNKKLDDIVEMSEYQLTSLVKIQQNRITRTRPIFKEWSTEVVCNYDPDQINENTVKSIIKTAGEQCGYGDWHPENGRFTVSFK